MRSRAPAPPARTIRKIAGALHEGKGEESQSSVGKKCGKSHFPVKVSGGRPCRGSPKSSMNWTKPPVSNIVKQRPSHGNATQEQGVFDNSTTAVAAFPGGAPALRTPGLSPSMKGGEDQISLAPTVATLPPSRASQTRPFSRLPAEQIKANSTELNMSENSVLTVVPRRLAPRTLAFQFAEPIAV